MVKGGRSAAHIIRSTTCSSSKESLPLPLQQRETPSDRRPLSETVCEGKWALKG